MLHYRHVVPGLPLLAFLACADVARAADAPDPKQLRTAIGFIAEAFSGTKPTKGEVPETAAPDGIPADVTADRMKKGVGLLAKSFYFSGRSGAERLSVEADTYHLPWAEMVTARLVWILARAKSGKNVLDARAAEAAGRDVSLESVGSSSVAVTAGAGGEVQQLQGKLTVRYPTGLTSAELTSGSTGEKRLSSVACKLLRVENDVASVWCSQKGRNVTLYPVSAKGVVLGTSELMSGPYAVFRELEGSGKLDDATIDRLVATPGVLDKDGVAFVLRAKGKIAKIVAAEPAGFQDETVAIQAFPAPSFDEDACPKVPSARFAPARVWPAFVALGDAALKKGIAIRAGRSEAMIGFNNHMILFDLPRVPNSALATVEVKDLVLTKAGKKVPYEPQGPFQEREGDGNRFSHRMEPLEGRQPVDFDVAKGKLAVRYPGKVTTRRVKHGTEDEAVAIQSCEVRVWDDAMKVEPRAVRPVLRAFAADGRELKPVKNLSSSGMENGRSFTTLRFWGEVDSVELDVVTDWRAVTIPFSLKPAPARTR